MRKLCFVPVLACLMAIPPSPASPPQRELDGVPSLVAVPSLPSGASGSAAAGPEPSDNAPTLIASSVAGDPLDHQEARDRVLAAKRQAQRGVARQREAAERGEPAPADPTATAAPVSPQLEAIAACESGGNPRAVGGGGAYRGKYQFDYGTWASVGGSGDPAAASEAEQDRRAAMLYARAGSSPWPTCGS